MKDPQIATAEDFRRDLSDGDCYEDPRPVLLPKAQKWVILRRPKPLAFTLIGAPLPARASVGQGGEEPIADLESSVDLAHWSVALWKSVFVKPTLSLSPSADSIHPNWIKPQDQEFIWRWIRGEVNDSGDSQSTFPAES